jgi:hypothetical protein
MLKVDRSTALTVDRLDKWWWLKLSVEVCTNVEQGLNTEAIVLALFSGLKITTYEKANR